MARKSARLQQEQARRLAAMEVEVERDDEAQFTSPPLSTRNTTTGTSLPQQPATPPLVPVTDTSSSQPPAPPLVPSVENLPAAPVAAPQVLSIRCRNPNDGVEAVRRRIIYSNKTAKVASASLGGRIRLQYSDFHHGPKSASNCSLLVRDIGAAVRAHVPMAASTFYLLKTDQKAAVGTYLSNYYEIPRSDFDMWRFIDTKSYERYKAWKHECHKHFKKHGAAVPFEFLNRPHEWNYLVNEEFLNKDKMALSVRNTNNRTKDPNPINHCAGARPLSYMAEEHLLAGHPAPYCAAAVDAYISSKNGREKALALNRDLEEIIAQREEDEDSENLPTLLVEDQCNLLKRRFGERQGTEVRGAGAALKRVAKPRGGPRIHIAQLEEEKRKAEERADKAEEEKSMLVDRVGALEATLQKFLDAQSGNDE